MLIHHIHFMWVEMILWVLCSDLIALDTAMQLVCPGCSAELEQKQVVERVQDLAAGGAEPWPRLNLLWRQETRVSPRFQAACPALCGRLSNIHSLTAETWNCATLQSKRDFAHVTELRS